jgi:uncharacterized protein
MVEESPRVVPLKTTPCPQCGQPAVIEFRPFCSRRCSHLDLGKWFAGEYRLASHDEDDPDEAPSEQDDGP